MINSELQDTISTQRWECEIKTESWDLEKLCSEKGVNKLTCKTEIREIKNIIWRKFYTRTHNEKYTTLITLLRERKDEWTY